MKAIMKRFLCYLNFNHYMNRVSYKDATGNEYYIIHSCACGKNEFVIGPVDDNTMLGYGSGVK